MARRALPRVAGPRAWAEYLGGTMYRLVWPCGHYRTHDLTKQSPLHRGIGQTGARLTIGWWSKEKGGVTAGPCPTCCKRKEA